MRATQKNSVTGHQTKILRGKMWCTQNIQGISDNTNSNQVHFSNLRHSTNEYVSLLTF